GVAAGNDPRMSDCVDESHGSFSISAALLELFRGFAERAAIGGGQADEPFENEAVGAILCRLFVAAAQERVDILARCLQARQRTSLDGWDQDLSGLGRLQLQHAAAEGVAFDLDAKSGERCLPQQGGDEWIRAFERMEA